MCSVRAQLRVGEEALRSEFSRPQLKEAGMETNFSLESLATGMYFVKINAADTSIVKRIVKQ